MYAVKYIKTCWCWGSWWIDTIGKGNVSNYYITKNACPKIIILEMGDNLKIDEAPKIEIIQIYEYDIHKCYDVINHEGNNHTEFNNKELAGCPAFFEKFV